MASRSSICAFLAWCPIATCMAGASRQILPRYRVVIEGQRKTTIQKGNQVGGCMLGMRLHTGSSVSTSPLCAPKGCLFTYIYPFTSFTNVHLPQSRKYNKTCVFTKRSITLLRLTYPKFPDQDFSTMKVQCSQSVLAKIYISATVQDTTTTTIGVFITSV
jgi:hypothetical protein